jgi:hypothetical protein
MKTALWGGSGAWNISSRFVLDRVQPSHSHMAHPRKLKIGLGNKRNTVPARTYFATVTSPSIPSFSCGGQAYR